MKCQGWAVCAAIAVVVLTGCDPGSSEPTSSAEPSVSAEPAATAEGVLTFAQAQAMATIDMTTLGSAVSAYQHSYGEQLPVVSLDGGIMRVNAQTFAQKFPGDEITAWGSATTPCLEYSGTVPTSDDDAPVVVHYDLADLAPVQAAAGACPAAAHEIGEVAFAQSMALGEYAVGEVAPVAGTCIRVGTAVLEGLVAEQDAWIVVDCEDDWDAQIVGGVALTDAQWEAGVSDAVVEEICAEPWASIKHGRGREEAAVTPDPYGWAHNYRDVICALN